MLFIATVLLGIAIVCSSSFDASGRLKFANITFMGFKHFLGFFLICRVFCVSKGNLFYVYFIRRRYTLIFNYAVSLKHCFREFYRD